MLTVPVKGSLVNRLTHPAIICYRQEPIIIRVGELSDKNRRLLFAVADCPGTLIRYHSL